MAPHANRAALLIDDSRLDQVNTRRLLLGIHAGFARLDWIDHWPGADAALAGGPYDLFLVDIHLGPASGLEVIRELRQAGVLAPIIALTGSVDDAVDRAATEAGASDFLDKATIDHAGLERSIRYAQRQADVHRELDRLNAALERRAAAEGDQARLMRFAIEQSDDAILLTKAGATLADHTVVYVNAAMCRLVGRRAGELLGSDVAALCAGGESVAGGALDRSVAAQRAFFGTVALHGSSGPVGARLRATPLRSHEHVVTHYVWSARDADDETGERSPELARRRARLEAIGRVAGGVAHAVNERLTTVIGNLELIAGRHPGDDTRGPASAALRAAEELVAESRLIAGLAGRGDDEAPVDDVDGFVDATMPLLRHAVGRLVVATRRPSIEAAWRVHAAGPRLEVALVAIAAWVRASMADGAVLEVAVRNRSAAAIATVPSLPATLDRHRDHVAVSMSAPVGASDASGQRAAFARSERARAEQRVADAGGSLVVERSGDGGVTATVYLPRSTAT